MHVDKWCKKLIDHRCLNQGPRAKLSPWWPLIWLDIATLQVDIYKKKTAPEAYIHILFIFLLQTDWSVLEAWGVCVRQNLLSPITKYVYCTATNELKGVFDRNVLKWRMNIWYRLIIIIICLIWIIFIFSVFSDLLHAYYKPIDLELSHPAK